MEAECRLRAWLDVFNAEDTEALTRFVETSFAPEVATISDQRNLRQRTGGYGLLFFENRSDEAVIAVLRARSWEYYLRLSMNIEPLSQRIAYLRFLRMQPPLGITAHVFAPGEIGGALLSKFAVEAARERFSGAVLVAKEGIVLAEFALGEADRELGLANTTETKFRIGSMNKMFTPVAIAQLAEKVELSYDDTITDHLPDYPNRAAAAEIAIAQLLTHTSGLGDIFGAQFDANRDRLRTLQDYIDLFGATPPEFKPGDRFSYSNFGYIVPERIIESISGLNYHDYARTCLPVHRDAEYRCSAEIRSLPDIAIGYTRMLGEGLKSNASTLPYRGASAGGGYSNVRDIANFTNTLLSGQFLEGDQADFLITGKVAGVAPGYSNGCGFIGGIDAGIRVVGHGGGAPGMSGELIMIPSGGYVIVVLSNLELPIATDAAYYIARHLPR